MTLQEYGKEQSLEILKSNPMMTGGNHWKPMYFSTRYRTLRIKRCNNKSVIFFSHSHQSLVPAFADSFPIPSSGEVEITRHDPLLLTIPAFVWVWGFYYAHWKGSQWPTVIASSATKLVDFYLTQLP
jgi:hypothetical protein